MALGTLAGADTTAEAGRLPGVPKLAIPWLRRLYRGPRLLNPLRPDRLGEALVPRTLSGDDGRDTLNALLELESDGQVSPAFDLLSRLCAYDREAADVVADVLQGRLAALVSRAEQAEPDFGTNLARLLNGPVGHVLRAAAESEPSAQATLAETYHRLVHLTERPGGHEASEEALRHNLELAERLYAEAQDPYHLILLCNAIAVLGERALDDGVASGLPLWRRHVVVSRELITAAPEEDGYLSAHGYGLVRLAECLVGLGEHTEARALFEEAAGVIGSVSPGWRDASATITLAVAYAGLAREEAHAKRLPEAEAAYRAGLKAAEAAWRADGRTPALIWAVVIGLELAELIAVSLPEEASKLAATVRARAVQLRRLGFTVARETERRTSALLAPRKARTPKHP